MFHNHFTSFMLFQKLRPHLKDTECYFKSNCHLYSKYVLWFCFCSCSLVKKKKNPFEKDKDIVLCLTFSDGTYLLRLNHTFKDTGGTRTSACASRGSCERLCSDQLHCRAPLTDVPGAALGPTSTVYLEPGSSWASSNQLLSTWAAHVVIPWRPRRLGQQLLRPLLPLSPTPFPSSVQGSVRPSQVLLFVLHSISLNKPPVWTVLFWYPFPREPKRIPGPFS